MLHDLQQADIFWVICEGNSSIAAGLSVDELAARQISYDALKQGRGDEHFAPDLGGGNAFARLSFGEGENYSNGVVGLSVYTEHLCLQF